MKPLIRLIAALLVVGCSVPADLSSPSTETQTETPSLIASPNEPSAAAPLPTGSAPSDPPFPALDSVRPIDAAARLLGLPGGRVRLLVERSKGTDPAEILMSAQGAVDPAGGRGQGTFDFSGFLAIPGASAASPGPENTVHVLWDGTHMYAQPYGSDAGSGWERRTRAHAEVSGGYIGRLPNEVLGLVRIVAESPPAAVSQFTDVPLEGALAEHYLILVPLVDAVASGVPADTPHVDVVRDAYGIDAIPVEVWLVDGELRRIGYVFEREKALYGGPDRTSVMYDWSALGVPVDIEIPPPGPIEDD